MQATVLGYPWQTDGNSLLLKRAHILVTKHEETQSGLEMVVSSLLLDFIVQEGAIRSARKERSSTVLPRDESYELQKQLVWQNIPINEIMALTLWR